MRRVLGGLLVFVHAAAFAGPAEDAREFLVDPLALKSRAALVVDMDSGEVLAAKNADTVVPIASLTKLMTALIVLDARQPLDQPIKITEEDIDLEKRTPSRLRVGTELLREDLLILALMSSENRAAMALSRRYPGGRPAFLRAMNAKAQALGMHDTRFADPTGLSSRNVSSASDLHRLLAAASERRLIREFTTQREHTIRVGGRKATFINSNRLVRRGDDWDIGLQKTGFTNEAGRCLVMQVNVEDRRLGMIFLDSYGTLTRYADASRVRRQLEERRDAGPAYVGAAGGR